MGPVDAWDRLESCPQKGKKKHIFKIVALLHKLKEKPGLKHRAGGFQNLSFFHSARCLLVPRTCPWLPGIHPACHLSFTLQNFLTHAHPPDESAAIRISLLMPCLSAPLRTCLCSAIHGLILAGIHVALSDPDRVQKQLSLKRDPSRTLPIISQQQIPTLPVLGPILSHCLCDSQTSGWKVRHSLGFYLWRKKYLDTSGGLNEAFTFHLLI